MKLLVKSKEIPSMAILMDVNSTEELIISLKESPFMEHDKPVRLEDFIITLMTEDEVNSWYKTKDIKDYLISLLAIEYATIHNNEIIAPELGRQSGVSITEATHILNMECHTLADVLHYAKNEAQWSANVMIATLLEYITTKQVEPDKLPSEWNYEEI